MRVALLSLFTDISSIGVRTISAYLKAHGISTQLLFLPLQKSFYSREQFSLYSASVVDQIASIVEDADLIGISLMSNFYETARDLTEQLKERLPHTKIVWGGVHATVLPEQCIQTADYVCIGEGEVSCLDLCQRLLQGLPTDTIPGMWSRQGDRITRTPPESYVIDLNQIPPPDYDLRENFILVDKKRLVPVTEKNMRNYLGVTYWTMYSRGCPFSCAYCCNDAYRRIHPTLVKLRAKSPQAIVNEILAIQERFPYIRYVNFQDDTFFALSEKDIKAFADAYKKHIRIPYLIPGLNPNVYTDNKFDYLVGSGLLRTRMGIQSGSRRIVEGIYKRKQDNRRIVEISASLQRYAHRMTMPNYDIIVDNPWETKEDQLETIALLDKLSPPYSLNIFSLEFFPGTRLYEQAIRENKIAAGGTLKPYYQYDRTYINLIIMLYAFFKIPQWLLKILLVDRLIQSNRQFVQLHSLVYRLILYRRGLCALLKRDYSMFPVRLQFFFCRFLPPRPVNTE